MSIFRVNKFLCFLLKIIQKTIIIMKLNTKIKLIVMKRITVVFVFLLLISCKVEQKTSLNLPALFTDHVVLQQNTDVPIWGWSNPEAEISIMTTWGVNATTKVNAKGKWTLKLRTPKAGGPYEITISTKEISKTIKDVLIGEVWLASGQSNMEMPVQGWGEDNPIDNSIQEIASSENASIRMFTVENKTSLTLEKNCIGSWKLSNPSNTGDFSATAYFFAKRINKELNVPIGIIHSSWGGTPAEAWTPLSHLTKVNGFENTEKHLSEILAKEDSLSSWLKMLDTVSLAQATENKFNDLENDKRYSESDFHDTDWKEMKIPNLWESEHLTNFDGIVWFRKDFEIQEGTNLKDLTLFLGSIDDMDATYVNGINVGNHLSKGFWNVDRLYDLSEDVLHSGKNTISIKVIDDFGGGGFSSDKDLSILDDKGIVIVKLSGKWKFLPVATILDGTIYNFDAKNSYAAMPTNYYSGIIHKPTSLFNAMIAPLVPFAIKGVIWYQGESNVGRDNQYKALFPEMIKGWRETWNIGNFPFYYVQIAPFKYNRPDTTVSAKLRHAQFLTLKEENVGMVMTTDIGEVDNVHPSNKQDVGKRLALWALNKTYYIDSIVYSGPLYANTEFNKNKAIISFTNIADGLVCKGKTLSYFEIAGKDSVFYKANATISNDKVIVWSKQVTQPILIRFGWSDVAQPNLFNSAGLPASPFKN